MPIQTPITIPDADINAIQPQAVAATNSISIENRLLKQQEELLTLQKEAYKSEYYPSLSLSGNYSYQGMGWRRKYSSTPRTTTTMDWLH